MTKNASSGPLIKRMLAKNSLTPTTLRRVAMRWMMIALWFVSVAVHAQDLALQPVQVAPDVYVVVGDLAGQTYENDGLNNNLGFVVGDTGVLVINTGPSARVARALHATIRKVTSQPVKWVVNVNSQNHYWHGNGYFKSQGATILASKEADRVMREVVAQQFDSNKTLLKEKADGTVPTYPTELIADQRELKLGKTTVQLLYVGPAHTPGDLAVWLPQQKILFSGDIIYTERLLAVIPIGNSTNWVKAFDKLMALNPKTIVPGHGRPTTVAAARRDTRDYLSLLLTEGKRILDGGGSLQDAVEKVDQSRFRSLVNFDLLARRNMNQVFQEVERDAF
jgi:glyoxylase-like metal-dependent hydrolase (beta-lactamase superfamily II)